MAGSDSGFASGRWLRSRHAWAVLAALAMSVVPVAADTVDLVGGDVLEGRVVAETETAVVIEHSVLGRLEIPKGEIESITLGGPAGVPAEAAAPPEAAPAKEAPKEEKKKKEWDLSVDFSFGSVSGNTDEVTLRFGFNAARNTEHTRFTADVAYYLKVSAGTTTDNKFTMGAQQNWDIPETPWFFFVLGRFDWDQFQSWEQRINAEAGPGYHIIRKETFDEVDMELDAMAGVGARKEFGSMNENVKAEGLLGVEYVWQITNRMSLDWNFTYFPVLSDFNDYRLRSGGNWRYVIDQDMNLSLLIGYSFEYQSLIDPGAEHYDLRIYVGIQYSF